MVFGVLAASGVLYESWDAYAETCQQARTVRTCLRQDYKHSHRRGRDGANETTEYGPLHETMRAPADKTRQDHLQPPGGPEPILEWKSLPSAPDRYVAPLYNTPESSHTTLYGIGSFPELSAVVIVVKSTPWPYGGWEFEPMSPGVWVIIRNDKQEDVEKPIQDLLRGFGRHYKVKRELDQNRITYERVTDDHSAVFKTWLWDLRVNGAVVARIRDDREVAELPGEPGQRWSRSLTMLYQGNKGRERTRKALGLAPRKVMLAGQTVHKECLYVKPTEITVSFEYSQASETADSLRNATRRVVHLLASIGQLDSPRDIRGNAFSKRKSNAFGNELQKLDCTVAAESDAGERLEMALSDLLLPENGADALAWERVVFSSRKERDVFVSYLEDKDFCVRIQRVGRNRGRKPLTFFSAVSMGIVEYIPQPEEGSSRYDKASDVVKMQLVRPSAAVLYDFLVSPYLEQYRKRMKEYSKARQGTRRNVKYRIPQSVDAKLSKDERESVVKQLEAIYRYKMMYFMEEGDDKPAPSWQEIRIYCPSGKLQHGTPSDYSIGGHGEPVHYKP